MTVDLSEVQFTSDFWEMETENGNTLILNKVNEEFTMDIDDTTYLFLLYFCLMELMTGLEPVTSSLPRKCSTC